MEEIQEKRQKELILPKSFSTQENYIEDLYTDFWEEREIKSEIKKPKYILNNFDEIVENLNQTQEIICTLTDDITSNNLIDILLELQKKGIRIYLLIEDPRDNKGKIREEKLKLLKQIANKTLIRTIDRINGHVILIDPHKGDLSKGFITNSRLIDLGKNYNNSFIKIDLNKNQIKEAFKLFKNLFWNHSQTEIINETELFAPKRIENSPFNFKEDNYFEFLIDFKESNSLSKIIFNIIEKCKENLIISSENLVYPENLKDLLSKKVQTLSEQSHIIIPRLIWDPAFSEKNHNIHIYGTDIVNFNFIITDNAEGVFILNGFQKETGMYLGIKLNKTQLKEVQSLFNYIERSTKYEYFYEKKLRDIKGGIEKYDPQNNKFLNQDIKNSEIVTIDDVQSKRIDDFLNENNKPDLKKYKKKGMKNIEYKWRLLPPYLPNKAKKCDLYEDWNNTQIKFREIIENGRENIEILLKMIDGYHSSRLESFFLGKKQKLDEINRELSKLINIDLKQIDISEAKKESRTVSDLWNDLSMHISEIDLEINNDKEINSLTFQIKELNEKIQKFQSEINSYNEEISHNEEILNEKKMQLEQLTSKKRKLKKSDEYRENIKELKVIINKLEQEIKLTYENKNKILKNKSAVEKNIESLKLKLKTFESKIVSEKEIKKRKVDELDGLREIMKSPSILKEPEADQEPKYSFKYLNYKDEIPNEKLPLIGTLFNLGKNRFLAIKYYSELDLGKQEASRLDAELVVNPN